jgi:mannose-6-phosphate isomerase-like protein (cupin superfamily)
VLKRVGSKSAAALAAAALALGAASLLAAAAGSEAVLDALYPEGRTTLRLRELAQREPLRPDEGFRVVALGRDAHTSHHVVHIRGAETPHRHDTHDLVVVILRGHGQMLLGTDRRPVGEGSILYIPRGTVHAFANESGEPAAAYAMYTPPFDGKDKVDVEAPPK